MLLLSAWLLLSPGSASATSCPADFSRVRVNDTHAPARLSFLSSEKEIGKIFELQSQEWKKAFDEQGIRKKLIRLSTKPDAGHDYLNYLQSLAAKTKKRMDSYELFSAEQSVPPALQRFSNALENLNEGVLANANVKELALDAERALLQLTKERETFVPASPAAILARAGNTIRSIAPLLNGELPTPRKFGVVTKNVANLLEYGSAEHSLHPTPASQRAVVYLQRLNQDLTRLHDEFLYQAKLGDINYEKQEFFLNPALRDRLEDLAGTLRASLSSSGAQRK